VCGGIIPSTRIAINPVDPEELARQEINRQFMACGWLVQVQESMNIEGAVFINEAT